MQWRKVGLVYGPDGNVPWARSHAIAPTPILLNGRLRIYFGTCDSDMVGRVTYVDLNPDHPTEIVAVARHHVLDIGDPGDFDDNGVNVTSVVPSGDALLMYYFGYQLGTKVRYLLFGGAAISLDGGETFTRLSRVPVIDRADGERLVRSAPSVLAESGSFRMWYVSGDAFVSVNGKDVPNYGLRHAVSTDGISWRADDHNFMSPEGDDEFGFGRPFVRRTQGGYEMWYSIRTRSKGYRLGYAVSEDGLSWIRRDDEVGIDVSASGWDSEAVCYSAVLTVGNKTLMFYNGNGYGRKGFGIAEMIS